MTKAYIAFAALAWLGIAQMADAHSGGCTKDSLPGQCCHRQHGILHCH